MDEEKHVDAYGDPGITSDHAPIPRWLIWTYIVLPIWGIFTLYAFWNGSEGYFDRGYWQQLQRAAKTTIVSFKEPVEHPLE